MRGNDHRSRSLLWLFFAALAVASGCANELPRDVGVTQSELISCTGEGLNCPASTCQEPYCNDGVCATSNALNGTPCGGTPAACTKNICSNGTCINVADDTASCGLCKYCSNKACLNVGSGQTAPGCNAPGNDCNVAQTCNGSGVCNGGVRGDGTPCTDTKPNDCYNAACVAGVCSQTPAAGKKSNGVACSTNGTSAVQTCYACSSGTCALVGSNVPGPGCNAGATECSNADACNGAGACNTNDIPAATAKPCGDGVCNQCDGAGACGVTPSGTAGPGCTAAGNDCSNADTCDGAGACKLNDKSDGTSCPDTKPTDCHTAACLGGVCNQSYANASNGAVCNADGTSAAAACYQCAAGTCTTVAAGVQGNGCTAVCNECNGGGACVQTSSAAALPRAGCSDTMPNDCYAAACVAGVCSQSPASGKKSDGLACSTNGTSAVQTCYACASGTCGAVGNGQPGPGCTTGATECSNADTCNGAGACNTNDKADGSTCPDSLPTNCFAAQCVGGACNQTAVGGKKTSGAACNSNGTSSIQTCFECNAGGACVPVAPGGTGTNCTATATECSGADTCDGAGACNPNHSPTSKACGDGVCNNCNGTGACTTSTVGASGPMCNGGDSECSAPDTCDASGNCDVHNKPDHTSCGGGVCFECAGGGCVKTPKDAQGPGCSAVATECSNADTCDGSGVCKPNHKSAGTPCGDLTPGDCRIAQCDGAGACVQAFKVIADGMPCGDNTCDQCSAGACVPTGEGLQGPGCNASGTECADPGTCDGKGACLGNPKGAGVACTDLTPIDCKVAKCDGAGNCDQDFTDVNDGDACGDGICDECLGGVCRPTAATVIGPGCTADSNSCTFDYCNGLGACYHPPKTGAVCDDGDPCSYADVCDGNAMCVGTKIECKSDVCGTRSCNGTSVCTLVAHDDVDCDADQDKCTPHDKCKGGTCQKDAATLCPQRDCYSEAKCNKATGDCESIAESGGACGTTGCYTAGTCSDGSCSGTPVDCAFLDEECVIGVCDTAAPGAGAEKCRQQKVRNGSSCSSANLCLLDPVCLGGKCTGEAKVCSPSSSVCRVATCEPSTGACVESFAPVGEACQQDNPCVQNAACDAKGACAGTVLPDTTPCATSSCSGVGECHLGECVCESQNGPDLGDPSADLLPSTEGIGDMAEPPSEGKDESGCRGCHATADGSELAGSTVLVLAVLVALFARRSLVARIARAVQRREC